MSSNTGAIILQGPHHSAQRSTKVTLSLPITSVWKLASENSYAILKILVECDASNEEHLDKLFAEIEKKWGKLDFVIHAIAFSNKDELKGRYVDTTQENFLNESIKVLLVLIFLVRFPANCSPVDFLATIITSELDPDPKFILS